MATTEQMSPNERLTLAHEGLLEAQTEVLRAEHEARAHGHDERSERKMSRGPLDGMGSGAAMSPGLIDEKVQRGVMHPKVGAVILYRSRTREYVLPAIVTATVDSLDRRGVVRGDVPDITGEEHVHLNVMSCGPSLCYQEFDIPYSREPAPGTWGWA